MPDLTRCSGDEVIRAFERLGYERMRQKGSHVFLKCPGRKSLSIPTNKNIGKGMLRSPINDSGFSAEQFKDVL